MKLEMKLLTKRQAAARIGKSVRHLERMIASREGPPFIRTGVRAIAFDEVDLEAWLKSRRYREPERKAS